MTPRIPAAETLLSLRECADRLGVHYMTAYKYVRHGRLPATKVGTEWRVAESDLEAFVATDPSDDTPSPWADRLAGRLLVGDHAGAWGVAEAAMAAGMEPAQIYTEVLTPAMRAIGEGWASGIVSVAAEHRATAVAHGIVGRLGPRFSRRGRKRGRVVIGSPPGERHALAVALATDFLRADGWEVISLGADLPIDEFVRAAAEARPVAAVAISVTGTPGMFAVPELVAALRRAGLGPIVLGGGAVDAALAARCGVDAWATDGPGAVAALAAVTA